MIPFARSRSERLANNDPRLSLEERYGTREGYLAAVQKAVDRTVSEGFLLMEDGKNLISSAQASAVLR